MFPWSCKKSDAPPPQQPPLLISNYPSIILLIIVSNFLFNNIIVIVSDILSDANILMHVQTNMLLCRCPSGMVPDSTDGKCILEENKSGELVGIIIACTIVAILVGAIIMILIGLKNQMNKIKLKEAVGIRNSRELYAESNEYAGKFNNQVIYYKYIYRNYI